MQARSFGTAVYAEIPVRKISEKERTRYGRRSGNPDGKGTLRPTAAPPGYGLQADKEDKIRRFRVGNEWRLRRDAIERWTVEQSMDAQRMRKVIDAGVNGGARNRRRAAVVRGPKR
jgi:hypothetical protein